MNAPRTLPEFKTYQHSDLTTARSAEVIVALLSQWVRPKKVIDIGCGNGCWLKAFKNAGAEHILGIDGVWTKPEEVVIPPENFLQRDLRYPITGVDGTFDLALSFEVAEHLPGSCSDIMVDTLTRYAPVVLFSSAIPFQGGIGHINEQWQSYWIDKFEKRGFAAIDCVRRHIWENSEVNWWYAQNMFLYVKKEKVLELGLSEEAAITEKNRWNFNVVHPVRILNIEKKLGLLLKSERLLKTVAEKIRRAF